MSSVCIDWRSLGYVEHAFYIKLKCFNAIYLWPLISGPEWSKTFREPLVYN